VIDVYLVDPEIAKAAVIAIDRAGGDISQADLRYSNLLDISFDTKKVYEATQSSTVASDPYDAGRVITVDGEQVFDLGGG
jgi:hypothetical protein